MVQYLELIYFDRKTITSSSLRSKLNLRRVDSGPKVPVEKEVEKGDHSLALISKDVELHPGSNTVTLQSQVTSPHNAGLINANTSAIFQSLNSHNAIPDNSLI